MPRRHIVIPILAGAVFAAHAAGGYPQQRDPLANPKPADLNAGKERLSDKASDEQRDDNCKVPRDKWGSKARLSGSRRDASASLAD